LNTPCLHTRGINILLRILCTYLNFQRGITAPVALGSMIECIFVQPIYQRDLTKKSTRGFSSRCKKLTHHADPHNPQPAKPSIFFHKRGTHFFADQPPGSSYRPRQVESKGASCIPRQPIALRFVGYPTFRVGRAGEAQRQSLGTKTG